MCDTEIERCLKGTPYGDSECAAVLLHREKETARVWHKNGRLRKQITPAVELSSLSSQASEIKALSLDRRLADKAP